MEDLPQLTGTSAQVRWAEHLRPLLLERLQKDGIEPDLYAKAVQIKEAAWWISNRDRPKALVRWPETWTKAPILPSPTPRNVNLPPHVAHEEEEEPKDAVYETLPAQEAPSRPRPTARRRYRSPDPERSTEAYPPVSPRSHTPTRTQFDADIAPIPDSPGMFALTVHFDHRTSGTMRLLREELAVLGRIIQNTLNAE